jgi:hypothetical protein
VLYDRVYRLCHRLDTPNSEVGSALRIEFRRARRTLRLTDGTTIGLGDRIGVLHMNNDRLSALHVSGLSPMAVGLDFRREIITSLSALAVLASRGDAPRTRWRSPGRRYFITGSCRASASSVTPCRRRGRT